MRRKLLGLSAMALTMTAPFAAIACTTTKSDRILFATAQGAGWPLSLALRPLVKYYNETYKNEAGFVPVKFKFADNPTKDPEIETHGITNQFQLIKKTKEDIETHNTKALPNIVLGDQSGAYIINQDQRLLDISDQGIDKNTFSSKIAELHSILAGQHDTTKLYNIPFDNADTNALQINLRVMEKMFELIEKGGGTVEKGSEIYKKVESSKKEKNKNELPEKTIWSALKVKKEKNGTEGSFKDLKINDDTFKSLKALRDFAAKFTEGVEIDESKVKEDTISGEVLSIDYQEQEFYKELHSRINSDKPIFELDKSNDKNIPKVKYNLVQDDSTKQEFKKLWEEWNKSIKRVEYKKETPNKKVFQSMKFMANGIKEWGSWNIFRFQSAISLAASVGANQNKITDFTRKHPYFGDDIKNDPKFDTNNAKDADVFMDSQITPPKENKSGESAMTPPKTNPGIFDEGGSSILPINVGNEKLNNGTKKFLKWIYTGKNKISGIEEENWLTLAKTSGYIMPLKEVVTKETVKKLEEIISKLETDLKSKNDITKEPGYFTLNMLRSSLLSLKSLVKLENGESVARAMVTDDKAAEITGNVAKALIGQTNIDGKTDTSADALLSQFETIIKK
ncbi:P68 family surface lipoprotein [Mycoplasma mycoides]|uniref:Glycerol ABC transporter glycerol-binding protein n=1 Tax=Mycoplasma mycoides subsp. capri TaxID=40477 RepID=A0AB38GDY9_MYCMC|nr:glycerol ABC transporter glycerol-binding protein [Mycoplasma mycoides]ACU78684.1 glycerol ABC transporter, glycerol binding protein [Mycoplasma mycoides subsp. capri str. GM12]ACU79515.1 glycerol ABC transporter, glycerol binding protein [Mycoplasma mycoides subsp. capri str. GM12]SRX58879.1 glycerol ABC transporter glycerol-binding protein [Mycoplasma mycoides subsp. capri]SRX61575.1 glycerol ABC transporter glycerol-binding protein [Mycoplasma mycoides subsp. capri]SRX64730.1 glycerol AB